MRTYGFLLVCMLCSAPRIAPAQLTARDMTALVEAIAERILSQFGTGAARQPFVMATQNRSDWQTSALSNASPSPLSREIPY
jgi:hypothetical protein